MAYLRLCNDIPWGLGSFGKYDLRTRHLVRMGVGAGLIRQSCMLEIVMTNSDISLVLVVHYMSDTTASG